MKLQLEPKLYRLRKERLDVHYETHNQGEVLLVYEVTSDHRGYFYSCISETGKAVKLPYYGEPPSPLTLPSTMFEVVE